ncbi:MAG TPA: hypothetical protein VLL54_13255 [Pyrinomonadaceae bacterium]|nr:hypothetical protein [Pyrinomonadaceae bacterium]
MRLKLVLASSLIAAIVGAGSTITIILLTFSSLRPISAPGALVVATYMLPTLTILLAAIFVYRHTARRRKLQAVLTVLISVLLILSIFFVASLITAQREPLQPQPPSDVKPI